MLGPEIVIAFPLAGAALLVIVLDRVPRRVTQWVAIAIAGGTFAATLRTLDDVVRHGSRVVWVGGWHPGNRVGLGIALGLDPAAAAVAALLAATVLAAVVFSYEYFEDVGAIFYVLILAMLGGMIGFAYAADLFDLFVWYEVFSVAAYALAAYRSESESAYAGALQFALTNSVAGLFFLVGITLLEGRTGELGLVAIGHSLASRPPGDPLVATSLACVAVGLFTRGALAPLHFWFDEVQAAAPTPLSAVLGGAMIPLALYGFARIYWTTYARTLPPSHALVAIFMAVGTLSAAYGTIMTLRESRLKRKLAHAIVAHAGVTLAALGAFTSRALAGAALYDASFALAAAALFFTIAIVRSRSGETDARRLRGAGRRLPFTAVTFGLAVLTLCAFGPGERAVADTGTPGGHLWLAVLAALVGIGTGGAFVAVFVRIFIMRPRSVVARPRGVPWFLLAAASSLALLAVAIGVVPAAAQLAANAASTLVGSGATNVPRAPASSGLVPFFAFVLAGVVLAPVRAVRLVRIAVARNAVVRYLRAIDDGDAGQYIAWIASTATALVVALTLGTTR